MKTAEEIIEQMRIEMPWHLPHRIKPYIYEAMRLYASNVATEALEDAAYKYAGITMKDDFNCICDVPSAIISTKIITP